MIFQDIAYGNRKIILVFAPIVLILLIATITLSVIGSNLIASDKYVADTTTTQTEAAESDLNLDDYKTELHQVIKDKFKEKLDGYTIADGKLLEDGSWYITTISIPLKSAWDSAKDTYRVILHNQDGQWQIVAEPKLIFAYTDYPDIPREIIFSANNL